MRRAGSADADAVGVARGVDHRTVHAYEPQSLIDLHRLLVGAATYDDGASRRRLCDRMVDRPAGLPASAVVSVAPVRRHVEDALASQRSARKGGSKQAYCGRNREVHPPRVICEKWHQHTPVG